MFVTNSVRWIGLAILCLVLPVIGGRPLPCGTASIGRRRVRAGDAVWREANQLRPHFIDRF